MFRIMDDSFAKCFGDNAIARYVALEISTTSAYVDIVKLMALLHRGLGKTPSAMRDEALNRLENMAGVAIACCRAIRQRDVEDDAVEAIEQAVRKEGVPR